MTCSKSSSLLNTFEVDWKAVRQAFFFLPDVSNALLTQIPTDTLQNLVERPSEKSGDVTPVPGLKNVVLAN